MLGVFAEFERALIVERITAGLERKAARGGWCGGRAPTGSTSHADRDHLERNTNEAPLVPVIFDRYVERPGGLLDARQMAERAAATAPRTAGRGAPRASSPSCATAPTSVRSTTAEAGIPRHTNHSSPQSCSTARRRSSPSAARTAHSGAPTPPTTCSPAGCGADAAGRHTSGPPPTGATAATRTTPVSPGYATAPNTAQTTGCPPSGWSRPSPDAYGRCSKMATSSTARSADIRAADPAHDEQQSEQAAVQRKLTETRAAMDRYFRAFEDATMPEDTCAPRLAASTSRPKRSKAEPPNSPRQPTTQNTPSA